jgi:hypothetical protein
MPKLTYDGDELKASEYHRTTVDTGDDILATIDAVNRNLDSQGFGFTPSTDAAYIEMAAKLAWTPEVRAAVAADRKAKAEREAQAAAEQAVRAAEEQARKDAEFVANAERLGLVAR